MKTPFQNLLPIGFFLCLGYASVQPQAYAQSQDYTYTTNNGSIIFLFYNGSGGAVTIPSTINGLPVTSIGSRAFFWSANATSVAVPNTITSIEFDAFWCPSLSEITVDVLNPVYSSVDGVLFNNNQSTLIQYPRGRAGSYSIPSATTSIGDWAFAGSGNLTSVTMGNSVTNIGESAFQSCISLTNVTINTTVISIRDFAFAACTSLTGIYFHGNAPKVWWFGAGFNATFYYLPGTTGWSPTFGGLPTALWKPSILTADASFGVQSNQFGFNISWASGMTVTVEACTDLANPNWMALGTDTMAADTLYFSDPEWRNYPARFYRLRSP